MFPVASGPELPFLFGTGSEVKHTEPVPDAEDGLANANPGCRSTSS